MIIIRLNVSGGAAVQEVQQNDKNSLGEGRWELVQSHRNNLSKSGRVEEENAEVLLCFLLIARRGLLCPVQIITNHKAHSPTRCWRLLSARHHVSCTLFAAKNAFYLPNKVEQFMDRSRQLMGDFQQNLDGRVELYLNGGSCNRRTLAP